MGPVLEQLRGRRERRSHRKGDLQGVGHAEKEQQ